MIHLEVAGVQNRAGGRTDCESERIGDRVIDREEFDIELSELKAFAFLDDGGVTLDAMLAELGLEQSQGELRTVDRDAGRITQQIRHGTNVILMAVGQHHCHDIIKTIGDRREVRQDQIDTRLGILREQHAAVDNKQLAREFEDGHIATDLAETAECEHAQAAVGQGRGRRKLVVDHAVNPLTRPAARSARNCAFCASVASTSGKRTGPLGRPCMASAAFVKITPCVRNTPV